MRPITFRAIIFIPYFFLSFFLISFTVLGGPVTNQDGDTLSIDKDFNSPVIPSETEQSHNPNESDLISDTSASWNPLPYHTIHTPVVTIHRIYSDTETTIDSLHDSTLQNRTSSTEFDANPTQSIIPGTIIITSIPDSVLISINDVAVGTTPYCGHGFKPGIYDIKLSSPGCEPFLQSISLQSGATEFVTGELIPNSGTVCILTTPSNATVLMNDTIVGMTPYSSGAIQSGVYELAIDLPLFKPYTEQLVVAPQINDTIQIALQREEKPIFSSINFKNSQNIRRIACGAGGIIFTVTGIIMNNLARKHLKDERKSFENYMEAELYEQEYTERYDRYKKATNTTNRYTLLRNCFYGIGVLGGAGFAVSLIY